jgi:signal transduction histidine kinase
VNLGAKVRWTLVGLPRADVALALGLFAVKVGLVLTSTLMSDGSRAVAFASAALLTLPLAWRRRAPLAVAAVVAAVIAIDDLAAGWSGAVLSFDCSIVAAYSSGAHARQTRAWLALAALLAANVVDALGAPGNPAGNLALGVVVFSLVPWLVGQALRRERRRTAQLRELALDLAAEREGLARVEVAAERARIARELHDIVAHSMTVVAVQADAAEKLLDRDPERARPPLAAIQETARSALTEMRRLVGLLRETDEDAPRTPQPGLEALDRLVDDVRASGLPVTLEIVGEVRPLPGALDLTAYRIVQEALTNVRKHAGPAHARVVITHAHDLLTIEVHDDGGGARNRGGGGHGLVGIQERIALVGGDLDAGATAEGFVVHARIPLARSALEGR